MFWVRELEAHLHHLLALHLYKGPICGLQLLLKLLDMGFIGLALILVARTVKFAFLGSMVVEESEGLAFAHF